MIDNKPEDLLTDFIHSQLSATLLASLHTVGNIFATGLEHTNKNFATGWKILVVDNMEFQSWNIANELADCYIYNAIDFTSFVQFITGEKPHQTSLNNESHRLTMDACSDVHTNRSVRCCSIEHRENSRGQILQHRADKKTNEVPLICSNEETHPCSHPCSHPSC